MIDAIKSVWHFIKDYSAVIILAVLLILFVFYMVTPIAKVDNDGLVIAFIGVLATFVVIGNFAQTTAIKTDIETKLSQLTPQIGDAIKIAEANKNDIKTITTNTETNTKDIAKLQTSVNTLVLNDTITHSDLAQFFSLFTGEQHDLLLIDGNTVGVFKVFFAGIEVVCDGLQSVFAFDELWNVVHRSWTIEGIHGDEIFENCWMEFFQIFPHAGRFELECADCSAFLVEFVCQFVIDGDVVYVYVYAVCFLYDATCFLEL